MRTKGSLTRDEAIELVGRNTVEALSHIKCAATGTELNEEGLVEFVASIDAVDLDGQHAILSAFYYQTTDSMEGGTDLRDLDWKVSGYEVYL